jgi:signal peptidase
MSKNEISRKKKTVSAAVTVFLLLCTLLCFYAVVQALVKKEVSFFGLRFYYVTTGSMEPAIPPGAVIAVKEGEGPYGIGDIISFVSKDGSIYGRVNTHRIVGVLNSGGKLSYITRGDANNADDAEPVGQADIIGRVVWNSGRIPVLHGLIDFLGTRFGFVLLILLPVLLITTTSVKDFAREYRNEMQRVREELRNEVVKEDALRAGKDDLN